MSGRNSPMISRATSEHNDESDTVNSLSDQPHCVNLNEGSQNLVSRPTTLDSKVFKSHGFALKPKAHRASTKSTVHFYTVIVSVILPAVGLIAWLATTTQGIDVFTSFASAEIGGHLTQTQAKAIDFVCSALLAPLSMAALNFIWFASARVCVVNETTGIRNGIPLQSLATASSLSSGTYNPLTFFILGRGKTWGLVAFILIALLSAIGTSALSNIIAYEAFSDIDTTSATNYTLRLLQDPGIQLVFDQPLDFTTPTDFNVGQDSAAAQNISAVLTGLTYEGGALDSDGGYVGANVTDASLNNLQSNVRSLRDVPGYRLSMTCAPAIYDVQFESDDGLTKITTSTNMSNAIIPGMDYSKEPYYDTCEGIYYYFGTNLDAFSASADFDFFSFSSLTGISWEDSPTVSNCGNLVAFHYVTSTDTVHVPGLLHTDHGDLEPLVQNITIDDTSYSFTYPQDTESGSQTFQIITWSLQCALLRQEGLLNYTRQADLSWSITGSSFDEAKSGVPSALSAWETLSYRAPGSAAPGIANAIWPSQTTLSCELDYSECEDKNTSDFINNFVYASGESSKILYNVAAMNSSRDRPEYFYNVTGTVERGFYRITYVPVLLLAGLIGIIGSALLTVTLILFARKTMSWKMFRQVDTLRLMVDSTYGGIPEDVSRIGTLGASSDSLIAQWAKEYYVAYTKTLEDGYTTRMTVRLSPKDLAAHENKWISTLEMDDFQQDSTDAHLRRRLFPGARSART